MVVVPETRSADTFPVTVMTEPLVGRVIYRSSPITTEQRDGIPFNQAAFAVRPRRITDVEP